MLQEVSRSLAVATPPPMAVPSQDPLKEIREIAFQESPAPAFLKTREFKPLRAVLQDVDYLEESFPEAFIKKEGYLSRLWSKETWDDWTEWRTPLGKFIYDPSQGEKIAKQANSEAKALLRQDRNRFPVVANPIPNYDVPAGEEYVLNVTDVFFDPDGDELQLTARHTDGTELVDRKWLKFDPEQKIFHGKSKVQWPSLYEPVEVRLTARDAYNAAVQTDIRFKKTNKGEYAQSVIKKRREEKEKVGIIAFPSGIGLGVLFGVGYAYYRRRKELENHREPEPADVERGPAEEEQSIPTSQLQASLLENQSDIAFEPSKDPVGITVDPQNFYCPISKELMEDPVLMPDGKHADRQSLKSWYATGRKRTCPETNKPLPDPDLLPTNFLLKELIRNYREQQGSLTQE